MNEVDLIFLNEMAYENDMLQNMIINEGVKDNAKKVFQKVVQYIKKTIEKALLIISNKKLELNIGKIKLNKPISIKMSENGIIYTPEPTVTLNAMREVGNLTGINIDKSGKTVLNKINDIDVNRILSAKRATLNYDTDSDYLIYKIFLQKLKCGISSSGNIILVDNKYLQGLRALIPVITQNLLSTTKLLDKLEKGMSEDLRANEGAKYGNLLSSYLNFMAYVRSLATINLHLIIFISRLNGWIKKSLADEKNGDNSKEESNNESFIDINDEMFDYYTESVNDMLFEMEYIDLVSQETLMEAKNNIKASILKAIKTVYEKVIKTIDTITEKVLKFAHNKSAIVKTLRKTKFVKGVKVSVVPFSYDHLMKMIDKYEELIGKAYNDDFKDEKLAGGVISNSELRALKKQIKSTKTEVVINQTIYDDAVKVISDSLKIKSKLKSIKKELNKKYTEYLKSLKDDEYERGYAESYLKTILSYGSSIMVFVTLAIESSKNVINAIYNKNKEIEKSGKEVKSDYINYRKDAQDVDSHEVSEEEEKEESRKSQDKVPLLTPFQSLGMDLQIATLEADLL